MNVYRACLVLSLLMPVLVVAQDRKPNDVRRSDLAEDRFVNADADRDGYVSRKEAEKSMPTVAQHFDRIDVNHDGHLSRDEFREAGEKMGSKP